MNNRDEMWQVLSSLDGEDWSTPDYAEDLWADLEQALDTQNSLGSAVRVDSGLEFEDAEISVLRPAKGRGFWIGAVAAAAVVLALVGVRALEPIDRPEIGASPTSSVPPVLSDPTQACARFAALTPTLAEIETRLDEGESVEGDDLRAVIAALDLLVGDLRASGEYDGATLGVLEVASASLGQAELEIERSLPELALLTVRKTSSRLESVTDGEDAGVLKGCFTES